MAGKRGRLLRLYRYLYHHTDSRHRTPRRELMRQLGSNAAPYSRAMIREDIQALIDEGIDIRTQESTGTYYWLENREFELAEVKLLIDAVSASKFISKRQSAELIRKLKGLASDDQAAELTRHLYTADRVKPMNDQALRLIDDINTAINRRKKIEFRYYEYNADKRRVYRGNGKVYTNSPYGLIWDNDHYYMVGWSEEHKRIVQFRVDRMTRARISEEDSIPVPKGFRMEEYVQETFSMYGGELSTVVLECSNRLMNAVIDKFGVDVKTYRNTEDTFLAEVQVRISPTFYGWVSMFEGEITIKNESAGRSVHSAQCGS